MYFILRNEYVHVTHIKKITYLLTYFYIIR